MSTGRGIALGVVVCLSIAALLGWLLEPSDALAGAVPRNRDAGRVHSWFGTSNNNGPIELVMDAPGREAFLITDILVTTSPADTDAAFWIDIRENDTTMTSLTFRGAGSGGNNPLSYRLDSGLRIGPGQRIVADIREHNNATFYGVTICGHEVN